MTDVIPSEQPNGHHESLWYRDAVIYELHRRAFNDSNDDGIGDIPGLLEQQDYLEDLGVTAIWLLPFYPSPLKDDGYDISDYTSGIRTTQHSMARRLLERRFPEAKRRDEDKDDESSHL